LCGYRFAQPTSFHKASTFGLTLAVVVQGAKRMRISGHELDVDATQLLVITRETQHEGRALLASPARPFLGISVCFRPEQVARALLAVTEAGVAPVREAVPAFVLPFHASLVDALTRLLATLDDPLDRKLLAPLILDEILYRLLRSDAAAVVRAGVGPALDADRVLEAMRFIREHHTAGLTVDKIARHAAMSPSHFAHRFRAVARISPMRYLREVRLERARALLLHNGARAGEVGALVGFDSPAHFAREFKRRFGVPPSQLRLDVTRNAAEAR
jgi:AraC-like DNA-binding protein